MGLATTAPDRVPDTAHPGPAGSFLPIELPGGPGYLATSLGLDRTLTAIGLIHKHGLPQETSFYLPSEYSLIQGKAAGSLTGGII